MDNRQQLRMSIRQRRNSLTNEQQHQAAEMLANQFISLHQRHPVFANLSATSFALYLTNDGEIDTGPLIDQLREAQQCISLPVLHPFKQGYLNFQRVSSSTRWTHNKYGIAEPQLSALDIITLDDIDVIFMPLVAFDASGNRLGMGGGYYDRTLSSLVHVPPKQRAILIGLAHDCQQVDSLPAQQWDVPIDYILTPSQFITCGG